MQLKGESNKKKRSRITMDRQDANESSKRIHIDIESNK